MRAVGEVAGGPDQIHLALTDALTPEGTLIMYASCPHYYDEVGRGDLTHAQEQEIVEKLPAFDPLTARSARDNGILVEFLRTYPGSRVSCHVARLRLRRYDLPPLCGARRRDSRQTNCAIPGAHSGRWSPCVAGHGGI
ncbi:MAG: AAC(3) family N-acetyltransferase [Acidobacteriaceae bacterium]|nr:AAC(3) family N-acetyltransferase [Acidobacteriaceae bacterium]MBV9500244.1 AAC(3) family N-acetyltransferase [Acidobacteriaceae bacterium]